MSKLFALFFSIFLFSEVFTQVKLPCDVGEDKYLCTDSVTLTTKSLLPGKWRIMNGGSGLLLNPTNSSTLLSNIKDPIVKVYWVNNDQSCADTIEIIQPKIGSTSLIKSGISQNSNELTICFNDDWKATTSINQGKSFIAYVLYKSKPPVFPNVYTDNEVFQGPIVFVNNDVNDGTIKVKYPNNTNEYWFLPVLYHTIGVSGPIIDSTCQITGTPFKIKYLDDINITKTEDCMLGSVDIKITGGTGKFNISNSSPGSILIDSSLLNIGELKLNNIQVKQIYGFDVKDDNGCESDYITKFSPCPACKTDVIYQKTYCITDSFPKPSLKEGAGIGRLELVPNTELGLVFDSVTGAIDIQNSIPGKYVLRNLTSKSCSNQTFTDFNIELLDTIPLPLGESIDTLCMPNPKIGDIKNISAQLITWYNLSNDKLDPAIDPAVHGSTYYCTQTIKGCESDKKGVKIFAPTISAPVGDTLLYICNKVSEVAKNVLFPTGNSIIWYDSVLNKINLDSKISKGVFYATQYLGCESNTKLKVYLNSKFIQLPKEVPDSLFFCKDQNPTVHSITGNWDNTFLYDLPNSSLYLENDVKIEQGLYYIVFKDTISNCVSERQKIWVNLPDFTIPINTVEPYCGFQNGLISIDLPSSNYEVYYNQKKIDKKIPSLKSGEYLIKIIEPSIMKCDFDTLINLGCKKSEIQEILSPNLDTKNDVLIFGLSESYPENKLFIYNRWGNKVFESKIPYNDDWSGLDIEGNPLPSSTYYYVIEKDRSQILKTGFIELIR